MTINKLNKILTTMIAAGHGRAGVAVHKSTFTHALEGDMDMILNVDQCFLQMVPQADDDGGTKILQDGTESLRRTLVLVGDSYEPDQPADSAQPSPETGSQVPRPNP